jgi:hypothetical protein
MDRCRCCRTCPRAAADLLNDRVIPLFESHDVKLMPMLTIAEANTAATPSGTNMSSLAVEDIDHTRTKARVHRLNGICERFNKDRAE